MARKMSETQNPETPEVQLTEAEQAQHYSELVQNRINKGIAYREAGGNPFATRYEPTHQAAGILAAQETLVDSDTVVRVAGRALTIRSFGKANFFHLLDSTGRIQVYVRKGEVPDADFEVFRKTIDTRATSWGSRGRSCSPRRAS
jgi:lysyl-tRNA synthetase class II